jgi:hypothetical protein
MRHREVVDVEDLGLDGDAGLIDGVAADDDEVCVEGLGDANGGGTRGLEVDGEAEVVESVLAVVAGDGEEAGGGETLVQGVREGVADPVQVGLAGAVVEREDQDYAATGGLHRLREGREDAKEKGEIEPMTEWSGAEHRLSIEL